MLAENPLQNAASEWFGAELISRACPTAPGDADVSLPALVTSASCSCPGIPFLSVVVGDAATHSLTVANLALADDKCRGSAARYLKTF